MSWDVICARHPNEWVVLIDAEYEDADEDSGIITSAVVLTHSKSSAGCIREAKPITDAEGINGIWHLYTGPIVAPPGWKGFAG